MSYSLALDPATGDLRRDSESQIAITADPSPELLLAICVPIGSFHGDPEQGSRVPEIVRGEAPADVAAELESAGLDAVARLEAAGLVQVERVEYRPDARVLAIWTEQLAEPAVSLAVERMSADG